MCINGATRQIIFEPLITTVVILGMIMPKKSRQVYDEMRRLNPGGKTMFLSRYTVDKIYTVGLEKEGLELFLNPVSPINLLNAVRDILSR